MHTHTDIIFFSTFLVFSDFSVLLNFIQFPFPPGMPSLIECHPHI
uniref:Uncharacterized protein n=1 Tax=Rhizophora mucronata TaxID=61149 RepID=A0A2P2QJI1_RHIMU